MKYIYAYIAPYSQDGCIEVEILDEGEVFNRLYKHIGLVNQFDTLDELVDFIDEWQIFDLEGGERITVSTLAGEMILQVG